MSQVHELHMEMTCGGCSNAAKKVLGKLPEVTNVEADVERKVVTVTSSLSPDALVEQLKKTGKDCHYIGLKQ